MSALVCFKKFCFLFAWLICVFSVVIKNTAINELQNRLFLEWRWNIFIVWYEMNLLI